MQQHGSLKPRRSDVCAAQRGGGTPGKLESEFGARLNRAAAFVEVSRPTDAANARFIQRTFVVKKR